MDQILESGEILAPIGAKIEGSKYEVKNGVWNYGGFRISPMAIFRPKSGISRSLVRDGASGEDYD